MLIAAPIFGASVSVSSHDDISRAGGNNSGSDGNTPGAAATFAAGSVSSLTINSTSGLWTCTGAATFTADGASCFSTGMHVGSVGFISSIDVTDFNTAVFGVFLDNGLPGSAPSGLRYYRTDNSLGGTQDNFTSFAPVLGQIFFIGDGLSGQGSGSQQTFLVPTGATRLFLGFADAPSYNGNPGAFSDNSGSILVDFSLNSAAAGAPEPGTWALLLPGIAGVLAMRRKLSR